MKRGIAVFAAAAAIVAAPVRGGAGAGEFHVAICEHYHVPQSTIVLIQKRNIPDDDLPVVFFIAHRARVTPDAVVALRVGGMSWMDVALRFHLTAEVFHVHFARDPGPPYGVAHGYYRNRKRSEWGSIRLADADMVHLVNVKFLAERHGCTPDEVVGFHAQGKGYAAVHVDIEAKRGKSGRAGSPGDGAPGKGSESAAKDSKGEKGPPAGGGPPKSDAGRASKGGNGGGKGRGR